VNHHGRTLAREPVPLADLAELSYSPVSTYDFSPPRDSLLADLTTRNEKALLAAVATSVFSVA
jgi:hypothetical protein